MGLEEWRSWEAALPAAMPLRERYTATLLKTLALLHHDAPFPWAVTGGTALQSYFDPKQRRYSTDLEIITTAGRDAVEAWMRARMVPPEAVHARILKCPLTPEGTLFAIHSYPQGDFQAAQVSKRRFDHYPLPGFPPPESLQVPLCSLDFLLATKLFAMQEPNRGGERKKDAYDLSVGLSMTDVGSVLERLEAYALHRGRAGHAREIARAAGAWLAHSANAGFPSLSGWLKNYVPDAAPGNVRAGLQSAVARLSAALGQDVQPTPEEQCRFIAHELGPADLIPIGKELGFRGDPYKQSEKLRDFILEAALPKMQRPLPADKNALLAALRQAARGAR